MNFLRNLRNFVLLVGVVFVLQSHHGFAQTTKELRDGQKDFDFEIGTWKTKLKRLVKPLSGSTEWVEYEGTTVVRKVWDGRANLVELDVKGAAGRIEALSLRLYNPESHQWSLNFANVRGGVLAKPTVGEFKDGRGEFYNQEDFNGRMILTRFIIIKSSADSIRFEQSFSDDGGKTWELNWIATDTRIKDIPEVRDVSLRDNYARLSAKERDGQHAFDWEFGDWKINIRRLKNPLSGSTTWTDLSGTVSQRKIWDGRANLAEVVTNGPNGRREFLALRLYNPQTNQWTLNFAGSSGGGFNVPMFGEFKNGVGVFYDQEQFNDRAILVRFTFASATSKAGRYDEQAFSNDGGKTWEVNWVNDYTKGND
jgi:hypothetical protein